MIYVSSSCVRAERIGESVETLARAGFRAIELSGGTDHYAGLETELRELRTAYGLTYLCHNYFPPPREPFVLNLASLDDTIYQKSLEHCRRTLRLSQRLGADRVSFHAGFFIDIATGEIGRNLTRAALAGRELALERFCRGYADLTQEAAGLAIYLENNVFSWANRQTFGSENPFMLASHDDYRELQQRIDFRLLLDIGHLKVSCHSLGLDFAAELSRWVPHADYLHLSDNDALRDAHAPLAEGSPLLHQLQQVDLKNKLISLEVYGELKAIKETCALVESLVACSGAKG